MSERSETVNQILGSSVEIDENGIAYVEFRVSTRNSDVIHIRMNAAQSGIASSSLRHARNEAKEQLEKRGLGLRSLDSILPAFPDDTDQ